MIEFQELWKIYTNWIKYVKHTVPKEKLLIFNVKQGIEPLAKFCGKPIPSWKMPYVNDSATFNNAIKMGKNTAIVVYTGNSICLHMLAASSWPQISSWTWLYFQFLQSVFMASMMVVPWWHWFQSFLYSLEDYLSNSKISKKIFQKTKMNNMQ